MCISQPAVIHAIYSLWHTCISQPAVIHAYNSLLSYMLTYAGLNAYAISFASHQSLS